MNVAKRLAALEAAIKAGEDAVVILFSEVGALDSDVTGILSNGERVERRTGESLSDLVGRAKAMLAAQYPVLWLEYAEASRHRRGDFLPCVWPQTHHQEATQ
jgi:hypothetical protein